MTLLGSLPGGAEGDRCLPCLVGNVGLLAVFVGIVLAAGAPFFAVGLGLLGLAAIGSRGYLLPGTPRFAPALVERLPLPERWRSDPTPDTGSLADAAAGGGEDVLPTLIEAEVLDDDGDRLYLDPDFEARWRHEMRRLAVDDPESLAQAAEALPTVRRAEAVETGEKQWLSVDGRSALVARPVAVAELAATRALDDAVDDPRLRAAAATPLRQFLDDCPVCEATLEPASRAECCGARATSLDDPGERYVCPECRQQVYGLP